MIIVSISISCSFTINSRLETIYFVLFIHISIIKNMPNQLNMDLINNLF